MDTAFAVDMSLPSAEDGLGATPMECMFVGAAAIHDSVSERQRSPISPILTRNLNAVEYHCDMEAGALDSAVDFSASSASDQLFDRGLPELGDCHLHPTASQWPMLSPLSLLDSAGLMHSNGAPEVALGARPRSSRPRANSSQSNLHKVDRARKTKGSQRLHYAVEKRYRSTLNEKYAALARTLSSEAIQNICRAESRDWAAQMDGILAGSKDNEGGAVRQRKTATLSATIETINLLTRCCSREARDLEQLRRSVDDIRNRVRHILQPKMPLDREQRGGS